MPSAYLTIFSELTREMMNSVCTVVESVQCNDLSCNENLQPGVPSEDRTRVVNTAVCPSNHLAITTAKWLEEKILRKTN